MYKPNQWASRVRALLLVGCLCVAPAASAVTRDGGFSFFTWLQRVVTSILTTSNLTECTCDTTGAESCGSLHIPGG